MMFMRESSWRLFGAALAVLGVVFLLGGLAAYLGNHPQYESVLTVFGGIFVVFGAGLVIITFFENNKVDTTSLKAPMKTKKA
jgi:type IV secretory pathway VirB2 component (pilin)